MSKLYDLAKILRSKNSGPFAITLDILFDAAAVYQRVKQSDMITAEKIAEIYHVDPADIKCIVYFDTAYGIKITMSRNVSSGTFGDLDVYGAQQHAPLMNLEVD